MDARRSTRSATRGHRRRADPLDLPSSRAQPALERAVPLTTDTHLAALAFKRQRELRSSDTDFARFPGLRRYNPMA